MEKIPSAFSLRKQQVAAFFKKIPGLVEQKPLTSFFGALGILFVLILASNFLRSPVKEKTTIEKTPKKVEVYRIGSVSKVRFQAQIEKTGVIKIVAQAPGIVSSIAVTEGQEVKKGARLVALSTNYQGGNAASLSRQLAELQYQNVKNTYDVQKELVGKQREIADKTDTNSDELRSITKQSIDETQSLLSLNENIVSTLDANLVSYTATNSAGVNDALILSTKQLKSQFQSAVNQLRSALRTSQYQSADDKAPSALANLQREITQKQLDLQGKALSLSLETSSLQLRLATVNEAVMFPSAPFAGVIERVHVVVGQSVVPGTPLLTLHGNQTVKAVVKLPGNLARLVSRMEPSTLTIGKKTYTSIPTYVSNEATDGQLYSVLYTLADQLQNEVSSSSYITAEVPIGYPNTGTTVPFVPLDAIYQTQEDAYVYTVKEGVILSRKVILGEVIGGFVQITSGIDEKDQIVTDRTVIAGEQVEIQN